MKIFILLLLLLLLCFCNIMQMIIIYRYKKMLKQWCCFAKTNLDRMDAYAWYKITQLLVATNKLLK